MELGLMGMEFQFYEMKNYGDRLYDNMNLVKTTELYT